MRRLWTEPVLTFEGKYHRITAAGLNPLPLRRPLPLWIGASAEAALKRAAADCRWLLPAAAARRWLAGDAGQDSRAGAQRPAAIETRLESTSA